MLVAKGLASNQNVKVHVNSLLPVNSKDQGKKIWINRNEVEQGISYSYIPIINIPIIRNICSSIYLFFKVLFKKQADAANTTYIVDYLRLSLNISVILACKIRNIKVLTIVTDLPGFDVLNNSFISNIRNKLMRFFRYDYYVCVTSDLNNVVNPDNKPSLVIESVANSTLLSKKNSFHKKFAERVIIYAGSLYERYGIKTLIEAFRLFPEKDLRLWIYGVGPYSESVIDFSNLDNRIAYKGVIPNNELLDILMRATLLVNPRPTHEEYTKYTFPSKNLEFMSTGTPLLTTRLHGIPQDHYPYVYFIEEDSVQGIYEGISRVINQTKTEIHDFGTSAKQFVLKEKDNISQTTKIINMIREKQ